MTTDEQKMTALIELLVGIKIHDADMITTIREHDAKYIALDCLRVLKQFDPEPLEVEIDDQNYVWFETYGFETKQKAIDFCAKHGLRVKK